MKWLGFEKPKTIVKSDEFTENKIARSIDDIKINVVATPEGRAIIVSAWNPDMALDLYKKIDEHITKKQPPKKDQPGIT